MFGLFYSLFVGLGMAGEKGAEKIISEKDRAEAKTAGKEIYSDWGGTQRLVDTNEKIEYTTLRNGDRVLKTCGRKSRILRNFSQEELDRQIKRNIEYAKRNGKSTYCITVTSVNKADHTQRQFGLETQSNATRGRRYKDFNTGNVYVIRELNDKYYFMDVNTQLLVRETDFQKHRDIAWSELYRSKGVNIVDFNRKKKLYLEGKYEEESYYDVVIRSTRIHRDDDKDHS